jgi:YebC/PmpR family DNA-binding regulatory protein
MSGHSKWANIKRKKEKTDAQKGKEFTKLGREIVVAVKQGGPDPESNFKLKDVIAKAKAANLPNDNIIRSIKKASGDLNTENYEEITYEGYGPGGIAVIVEVMTDNRNRTAGDLRHYFDKFGGNLGTSGCVSFLFDKKGVILIENDGNISDDDLMIDALELGVDDFIAKEEYYEILTVAEDFYNVKEGLESKGYRFVSAEIEMVPQTTTRLEDPKHIEFMEKLINVIEEHDDVGNVYHNWECDDLE